MSGPVLERVRVAPQARTASPRGLMVLVNDEGDVVTRLVAVAERARAERRPVLVGLVEPPRPLTINALMQARHERIRAAKRTAVASAALAYCAGVPEVGFVEVRQPRALTAERARCALLRRAQCIATRTGSVLVPC